MGDVSPWQIVLYALSVVKRLMVGLGNVSAFLEGQEMKKRERCWDRELERVQKQANHHEGGGALAL